MPRRAGGTAVNTRMQLNNDKFVDFISAKKGRQREGARVTENVYTRIYIEMQVSVVHEHAQT